MKKYKILLVDDDIIVIKGISLYLEQKGYHVFTANSGRAAIEILQTSTFDMVLTDLVMPDIDGFQVLKKAKKLYPEIMVLVMTGFGDVKFAIDCLRLGADDYMLKHNEPEEMLFRVKSCLVKLEIKRKVKKIEKALQESETRYRSFVENFRGIAYRGKMDFTVIFFHGAVFEITGYSKDEFVSGYLRWDQIIHPDDLCSIFIENEKKLHTVPNYSYEREYRIIRRDGKIRWVKEIIQNICDESGQPPDLQGVIYDITDRREAVEALKYTKLQLEAIFNNLDSSIYISDMKSYEILFMNNHMKELFGEDLTGNICWKSIHNNQDGPCEFCTNNKLTDADGNSTEPYIWEFYNQKLRKWYELHDMVVPWLDGKLVRMEIATDITDRKQVEQKQDKINEMLEDKVKERTANLEDMNTALKVLLNKREKDKKEIEEKQFANYKLLILPFIDQLRNSLTRKNQEDLINILESELKDIISPFSKKLSDPLVNLTPTEIKVASLIKLEKSNKEIAEILNSSIHTISHHRENIRKKTGLKNKKINLRSFLSTLY